MNLVSHTTAIENQNGEWNIHPIPQQHHLYAFDTFRQRWIALPMVRLGSPVSVITS